jgi:hypothetical protein
MTCAKRFWSATAKLSLLDRGYQAAALLCTRPLAVETRARQCVEGNDSFPVG